MINPLSLLLMLCVKNTTTNTSSEEEREERNALILASLDPTFKAEFLKIISSARQRGIQSYIVNGKYKYATLAFWTYLTGDEAYKARDLLIQDIDQLNVICDKKWEDRTEVRVCFGLKWDNSGAEGYTPAPYPPPYT